MDQDATWYGGRPKPGHIVLNGDPAPPEGASRSPPCLWRPNGWMDQAHLIGTETGLGSGDIVRWEPSSPSHGKGQESHFSAHVHCTWPNGCIDGSRCQCHYR